MAISSKLPHLQAIASPKVLTEIGLSSCVLKCVLFGIVRLLRKRALLSIYSVLKESYLPVY